MFLLSKIIVKEWLQSLIGAVVVLFLLITVGDILNGFLQNYPLYRIFVEYILKLPELLSKMLPISALLATLFAFNKLKTRSELMGILAGGYSAPKIYTLILGCALFLGAFQFLNLAFLVPYANKIKRGEFEKSRKNESKYLARSRMGNSGLVWYKSKGYYTSFEAYDAKKNALLNIAVYFISKDNKLKSVISAKQAHYIEGNSWMMKEATVASFLANKEFPELKSIPEFVTKLNESPQDFKRFESDITTLNFFQLGRFISRIKNTDINVTEYQIIYFEKISLALICIIFSLFPLSTIFAPNRRAASFGKSIVITLLFSIAFWLVHSAAISMGNSGKIPVIIATLGIPVIFIVFIVGTFIKNKRL